MGNCNSKEKKKKNPSQLQVSTRSFNGENGPDTLAAVQQDRKRANFSKIYSMATLEYVVGRANLSKIESLATRSLATNIQSGIKPKNLALALEPEVARIHCRSEALKEIGRYDLKFLMKVPCTSF